MTNAFSLFRSLVIYGVCLPLAIFVGYLLATPTDALSLVPLALLLALMTIPLFLRWHYPWLILSWNLIGGFYFLPGKIPFTLVMIGISFFFSVLTYVMNRNLRFISVPSLTWPLAFITLVIVVTAKLTGGFGLNILGSEAVGGKRYVFLLSGVVGYFALTAQPIPARKAKLYVTLFFIGSITAAIGNLFSIINPNLFFIFDIFPADIGAAASAAIDSSGITRLSGVGVASTALLSVLLARYGIQGILDLRRYWRVMAFVALVILSMFGGFRSNVINIGLTLMVLFYLEGLMRSRLLPIIILWAILGAAVLVPFSDKLPLSIQRSLAFLPLKLDIEAELNAQASMDWRLEMWKAVLPTVPQHLILGKGLGIDAQDFALVNNSAMTRGTEVAASAALAGDYHSGPLSLIIPFGLPGVFGFCWFLFAGYRVLSKNYHFGDPEHQQLNRFLFAFFIVKILMYIFIFGSFYSDLAGFVGPVGLSIALNGGVRSPALEPVLRPIVNRFRLVNATR